MMSQAPVGQKFNLTPSTANIFGQLNQDHSPDTRVNAQPIINEDGSGNFDNPLDTNTPLLGEGGKAAVYLQFYRGQPLAVKYPILPPPTSIANSRAQSQAIRELVAEAELHKQMNSPYIIKCYGLINNPRYGMILEYTPTSLATYIDNKTGAMINWPERYQILSDVARGLKYLHTEADVIHADIKAENVLLKVTTDPLPLRAQLCDFGFARYAKVPPKEDTFAGTIDAIAPELWHFQGATPASDMYSFAILCLNVATNKMDAYDDISVADNVNSELAFSLYCREVKSRVLKGQRPAIPAQVPAKLAEFITWGWAQQPEKRPTADQAVQAFTAMLGR